MLTFRLIGSVEAARDGASIDLGTRKQRALLAMLLIESGRVVSVDRIVDELWSGQPPARASASLQAYISNLRRALEPERASRASPTVLVTDPPGYRLRVDRDQIDVGRFERLATEARELAATGDLVAARARAEEALDLWHGPALAEFADETWARGESARLEELRVALVEDRLAAMVDLGEAPRAAAELEALVEQYPLRERLWGLLMLACYRSGRGADALARYQQVRALLAEELGLEPGPELRELEGAILRQDEELRAPVAAPAGLARAAPAVDERAPVPVAPVAAPAGAVALVGRDEEARLIDPVVAASATTQPQWLLLEGEAGIGKTRLAEELAARAAAAGAAVAWGRCHEDRDAPGFWPWLQILSQLGDDAAAQLTTTTGEGDRFARYQFVAERLVEHARNRPVLVVIDDLHWADPDSLRLLAFVAVQVHGVPVTVAATCRDNEPSAELAEALVTITRRDGVRRVAVGPLDVDDVAALADAITGEPLDRDEAARVHQRTAGNAFLAAELLRLPADQRVDTVPGSVRDVVERRIARLPEESRSILGLAAVAGREFDLTLLERASGVDLDRLVDLVDAALARRVVLAVSDAGPGTFRFAHDLLRDVLLDDLGALRRMRLHARLADAIDAMPIGQPRHVTELARHRVAAAPLGGSTAAVKAALAAAERAERALAFDEAVTWYEAAHAVLDADATSDPDRARRQDLLLHGAQAMARAGRVLPWRVQVARALTTAIERDDVDGMLAAVQVLVGGGWAWLWSLSYEDPTEVLGLLEDVLSRLDPADDVRRSRVIAAIRQGVYYRDGPARATALADEALELARRSRDGHVLRDALLNLALCLWGADGVERQLGVTDELLGLPDVEVEQELAARAIRTTCALVLARLDDADAEYRTFVERATQHGRRGIMSQLAWYEATRAVFTGDVERSGPLMAEARRLQLSLEVYLADLIYAGAEALRCFTYGRIEELPEELVATLTSYEFGAGAVFAGLVALERGDRDTATTHLETVADMPSRQRDWLWLNDMLEWADLVAGLGRTDLARAGLDALTPYRSLIGVAGTAVGAAGPVAYAIGRLSAVLGDDDLARAAYAEGCSLSERMRAAPWIAKGERLLASVGSS